MNQAARAVPTVEERFGKDAVAHFRKMGWWKDGSLSSLLDRWAREVPTRRAVSDGVLELDYARLRSRAYGLAQRLLALGVKRGDRVAMQLPNWTEAVVIYHAVSRMGCVLVPMMMVYRHAEVVQMLTNSGASAVFATGKFRSFDHAAMFREIAGTCPELKALLMVREGPQAHEVDFEQASPAVGLSDGECLAAFGPYADPDAPHMIIYTSGTESTSKGCVHTWNTFDFSLQGLASEIFEVRPDDTMFVPSPVGHSTGLTHGVAVPQSRGAGVHLQEIWEPHEALRRIEAYGCTASASATPFVRMAIDAARESTHDLSSMRTWLCAGAPVPVSLAEEFSRLFPNAQMLQLYGCSEIMMMTCCRRGDPVEMRAATAGRIVLDGVEGKLVKEGGQVAGPGEEGEILYRGPGAMLGYWNDPQRTANAIDADGWYHTGDLGVFDENGYLRVSGRLKDIIIRGGANISASEVEGYLLQHPRVRDVAAVSYPDRRLGERVCAYIVLKPGESLTLDELVDFLRTKQISPQKFPERLEIVAELPMTPTGKVQKFRLRQMARQTS